ncbi:MAG: prepilin-type N-terminal cleavage/methylation domain-containing protein [Thermodesulfobacteriota bacterium]|nr:prepilin-type N-terminal cleavage/methylation domain-containing protein [Thermodesulfobacteriota bacterium]
MLKIDKGSNIKAGFTLVEIAIVMVIIGLLIGGVLKGQAMIQNAKVKRVVKQAEELRAAILSFYDKYGVYPGDENKAALPPGADWEGDGDGQIEKNRERFEVYLDLQLADLIRGSYNGTSDLPVHAFGGNVEMYWVDPGPGTAKHCFLFYNLPAEACLEIDAKYDDSAYDAGSISASEAYTAGTTIATFYIIF